MPVVGDTIPGQQQRTAVDLPVMRREAVPEVKTEVVQGAARRFGAKEEVGRKVGMIGFLIG